MAWYTRAYYQKCAKCGIVRNILEAEVCPICKLRGKRKRKSIKTISSVCKYCGVGVSIGLTVCKACRTKNARNIWEKMYGHLRKKG